MDGMYKSLTGQEDTVGIDVVAANLTKTGLREDDVRDILKSVVDALVKAEEDGVFLSVQTLAKQARDLAADALKVEKPDAAPNDVFLLRERINTLVSAVFDAKGLDWSATFTAAHYLDCDDPELDDPDFSYTSTKLIDRISAGNGPATITFFDLLRSMPRPDSADYSMDDLFLRDVTRAITAAFPVKDGVTDFGNKVPPAVITAARKSAEKRYGGDPRAVRIGELLARVLWKFEVR